MDEAFFKNSKNCQKEKGKSRKERKKIKGTEHAKMKSQTMQTEKEQRMWTTRSIE